MPGTITVDTKATFSAMLLMNAAQKLKFGTEEPDITANGEKKFTAEVAVTYQADPGMRAVSEVISVTVTGGDSITIPPGSAVDFDRLRCGVSAPEKRDNGRVVGGKLYWMAAGIRPASSFRPGKAEAA